MHKTSHLAVVAAILLIVLFPVNADADWMNDFTYDVTVSNSASGPFTPYVKLWSSNVPAGSVPSFIELEAMSPWSFDYAGTTHYSLASSSVMLGNHDQNLANIPNVPFFLKLKLHDKASGLSDSLMFGGKWKGAPIYEGQGAPPEFLPDLDFTGYGERQIGKHLYKVQIGPPLGLPFADERSPGQTISPVDHVALTAMIDRTVVASTPEPTTLLLALPAAFVLGAGSIRKRWFQA